MNDNNNPKISKAAKFVRDVTLEPYDPVKPTFSDRATKLISEVSSPDLSEEERRADINRLKPWFQGSWSFFSLLDGHPLLALLPYAGAIKRNVQKRQQPRQPTSLGWFLGLIFLGFVGISLLAQLFGG